MRRQTQAWLVAPSSKATTARAPGTTEKLPPTVAFVQKLEVTDLVYLFSYDSDGWALTLLR